VVTARATRRVVAVRQDGDAFGLRHVVGLEVALVGVEDVDALLHPFAAVVAGPQDDTLRVTTRLRDVRALRHFLTPDVLYGLHRPRVVGKDRVDGGGAVVLARPLVGTFGKLLGPPRPREHRIVFQIPVELLAGLDAEIFRVGAK